MQNCYSIEKIVAFSFSQKEIEEWRRPRNFNKALGEAQHLIEYADMNKVFNNQVRFTYT